MIGLTDETGSTAYPNRSGYETTGQTAQQALGQGWLDAVHPEDRELVLARSAQARRSCTAMRIEYRMRRRDAVRRGSSMSDSRA
ncbi:PAS domain-containing protein [Pandoraea sputorum]|uniref:PAS domain-containing protein n=1 Tax=Pandoraea sputorum TaxID=93222 RepID=UPI00125B832C|nr:PAS domain-containing protein [Pandoraea sputorum]VVE54881.1 diguanylate cyclase [Pandoraea sputorum]